MSRQLRVTIQVAFHADRLVRLEPKLQLDMDQFEQQREPGDGFAGQIFGERRPLPALPFRIELLQNQLEPVPLLRGQLTETRSSWRACAVSGEAKGADQGVSASAVKRSRRFFTRSNRR